MEVAKQLAHFLTKFTLLFIVPESGSSFMDYTHHSGVLCMDFLDKGEG